MNVISTGFWIRTPTALVWKTELKGNDIFNLYSDKSGHTVCVTKDRETMVTNERVVNLNPACWEKEMLEYFGNKYTVII